MQGRIDVAHENIDALSELVGRPPRILELFWKEVGAVSFAEWKSYAHLEYFGSRGMMIDGEYELLTDVLVVDGPCRGEQLRWEFTSFQNDVHRETERFVIPLGPDRSHKDDVSGGLPDGIEVGDDDWLPLYRCDDVQFESTPDFMTYLRAAVLVGGGFLGLCGAPAFEPLRQRLTKNLLSPCTPLFVSARTMDFPSCAGCSWAAACTFLDRSWVGKPEAESQNPEKKPILVGQMLGHVNKMGKMPAGRRREKSNPAPGLCAHHRPGSTAALLPDR